MKTILTGLLIGAIALLPLQAEQPIIPDTPPQQQEKSTIVMCVIGGLVIVIGVVVVIGLVKMCNKLPPLPPPNPDTNAPPVITNKITLPPIRHASMGNGSGSDAIQLQQRASLDDQWQTTYVFTFDQQMNCIVYFNGSPILTNTAPGMIMTNGELQAWYDFRSLPLPGLTNGFFRIVSP